MKTSILIIAALLTLSVSSCIQDEAVTPQNQQQNTTTTGSITDGSWVITYFWDSDKDETYHLTGFTFTFQIDGILRATNGNNTYSGTWTNGNDDSDNKLDITFSGPSDLTEISDDWHILQQDNHTIRLEDVSGGNGGTDYLTFEKI